MRYRFVILPALLLGSCSNTPDHSPCADIDCSGHGMCVVASIGTDSIPTCQCDQGYAPTVSGMLCLPDTDTSLCAGISCSDHGTCVSLQGLPWCLCEPGYQVNADGSACEDPCAIVDCGGHGTCEATEQGATCTCEAGYQPSLDDTSCDIIMGDNQILYLLTDDDEESDPRGRMILDLSWLAEGRLVELMHYYSWRSPRKTRQVWTLDSGQQQVTQLEYDDHFAQGSVSRRRWGQASFDQGSIQLTLQRTHLLATIPASYKGSSSPVPMLGGFEYPGMPLGCHSAAFYMQALQRHDPDAPDPQQIEVYWPTSGMVTEVRVEKGSGYSPGNPVLLFIDQQMEVSYTDGLPETIRLLDQERSWKRTDGVSADLNLQPLEEAVPFTPAPLPTDLTETPLAFDAPDGAQLAGTLTLPADLSPPVPAVLLVSDMAAANRDAPFARLPQPLFSHLAAHLAHAGFATLRYDPRGLGASQGDASLVTLQELVQDATAARDLLASTSSVDASRIYLLSHGTGSMVALALLGSGVTVQGYLALAPVVNEVDQVLLYSATKHLEASGYHGNYLDYAKQTYLDILQQISDGSFDDLEYQGIPVSLWQDWLGFDGLPHLAAYTGPVLMLRGDQDLETPPDQLDAAQKTAQDASKDNLTATTLAGLTFIFTAGSMDDLWETAVFPLDLSTSALSIITGWLDQN